MTGWWSSALAGTLGGALVVVVAAWSRPPATIAVVDLGAIIAARVSDPAIGTMSEQEMIGSVNDFGARITQALEALAREYHAVILPQGAVAAGAVDLTPLLARRLGLADAPAANPAAPGNQGGGG